MQQRVLLLTMFAMSALFAGCSGSSGSMLPGNLLTQPGVNPTPTPSGSPSSSPSAAPSAAPTPSFIFPSPLATLVPNNPIVSLTKGSVTFAATFSANTGGNGTIDVNLGLNNGDIVPALPTDNANVAATVKVYASFYNPTSGTIRFGTTTPLVVMTDTSGFGGATVCELDAYTQNGSSLSWNFVASGAVLLNTATIAPVSLGVGGTVSFNPGQQLVAVACH